MRINNRDRELIIDIVQDAIKKSNEKKFASEKLTSEARKMMTDKFKKEIEAFVNLNKSIEKAENEREKVYEGLLNKGSKLKKDISHGYGNNRREITKVSEYRHDDLENYYMDKLKKLHGIREIPRSYTIEREILMASSSDLETVIEKLTDKFAK